MKFDKILLEAVVLIFLVQNKSLTPMGMPSNRLFSFPCLRLISDFSASSKACSAEIVLKQLSSFASLIFFK